MPPHPHPGSHSTAVHFMKTASRCCANLVTWWSPTSRVNSSKAKTISCSSCVSRAYAQPCLQITCKCLRKESLSWPHVRHQCNCYYCTTQPQQCTATKQPSLLFQPSFLQSCKQTLLLPSLNKRGNGLISTISYFVALSWPSHFTLVLSSVKWKPLLLIYPQAREHLRMQVFKKVTGQKQ